MPRRFSPLDRNMSTCLSADDDVVQPFELQCRPIRYLVLTGFSGAELEHVLRLRVRRVAGARIGLARWNVALHMNDALLIVDPDHVDRNERVLHPERILATLREKKELARSHRHAVAIHQTLRTRLSIGGNLDANGVAVGKGDDGAGVGLAWRDRHRLATSDQQRHDERRAISHSRPRRRPPASDPSGSARTFSRSSGTS